MVRKHTKNCPVPLVPTTVDLRVILYEVLGKYKILPGVYKIIISNSAHKITSFWVFVINIIKMNLDWKNCHHYWHSEVHLSREYRRLPPLTFLPVVHLRVCPKCSWKLLSSYICSVSSVQDFFFLSRFSFTNNIYESQDCRGKGRAFLWLFTTSSTGFTGT